MSDETPTTEVVEKPKRKPRAKKANGAPPRKADPESLDQFGLRKGSLRSRAAAMYGSESGATLAEVKKDLGITQFNVLTQLEAKGFKVRRESEKRDGSRKATRYFVSQ